MAEDKKISPVKSTGSVEVTGKPERPRVTLAQGFTDDVLYADGVQGISLRAGVARIDLYQVMAPPSGKEPEQRVLTRRIAVPVNALGELARSLAAIDGAMKKARAAKETA